MAVDSAVVRASEEVVDRVAARHPTADRDLIRARVDQHLGEFRDARVRDFVAVLVEHRVLEDLRKARSSELTT